MNILAGRKPNNPHISKSLDNVEKIFLMLLRAGKNKPIPGNLWLQKEMFMIAKNLQPLENYLEFQPHLQGPYSESVENKLQNLEYKGFVSKRDRNIELTERGKEIVNEFYPSASKELIDLIEDVKNFVNDLTQDELLLYVYYTYGMASESYELENIEQKREKLAKRLYKKGKVSLEKASELAGLSIFKFKREI